MENRRAWFLAFLLLIAVSIAAVAHEGGKHFLGTVKAFDQNTVTVPRPLAELSLF